MNKTEIKKIVKDEVESIIKDLMVKEIKKPEISKIIKNMNKEALTAFVRTLWTQRSFWDSKL